MLMLFDRLKGAGWTFCPTDVLMPVILLCAASLLNLLSVCTVCAEVPEVKPEMKIRSIPKGMQLYFATTRLNEGSRSSPQYGGSRHLDLGNGSLEFGTAALRTPKGLIEPARAKTGIQYRDLLKVDSELWHKASINFIGCFDEEDLLKKVRNFQGKVCIYIHGYDKPFNEALQDASMLFADYLQYEDSSHLMPVLFSWPSVGGRSKYPVDEANVEWSKKPFDLFMDHLIKELGPNASLEVVGHSMGNRLVVPYLTEDHAGIKKPFVDNLFLCAADLDFHSVESQKGKIEESVSKLVYVTVSDKDRPLIMSQYMHGQPRMGRPVDPPGSLLSDPAATPATGKPTTGDFFVQLGLEAAEFWFGPSCTDTPDVVAWLSKNPSLDQEFGPRTRLLDVTDLALHTLGHGVPWSVVSSIMAGSVEFPQLHGRPVHKRPDRAYLQECGGTPRVLYRYTRLDPL